MVANVFRVALSYCTAACRSMFGTALGAFSVYCRLSAGDAGSGGGKLRTLGQQPAVGVIPSQQGEAIPRFARQGAGRHVCIARHGGQITPRGRMSVSRSFQEDSGGFRFDARLQDIGAGNFLGFHQRFGGPDAFLADAKQLLREFQGALGHKYLIEASPYVGQHSLSLRLPCPLGLPNLLLSHALIEPEFSGGDNFLADEAALLATPPFIADFGTDVARHGVWV